MIMNPTAIKHVVVDGHSLTLESFVAIARYNATVELAPSALEAMQKSRALAEKIAAEGRVAYGITTGFGEFQKVAVPKEMSNQLSTNLILSHCTAAGGLWRQRGIFPEDSQSCQAVYRFKQFRGRRIYVSGQNAAVCTGTLHENEGTAGASGKYRCAD